MALATKYDENNQELMEIHNSNNQKILSLLKDFQEYNSLKAEDFIVGGSCAGNYMNYMTNKYVRDVDIIPIEIDKQLEITSKIDIIRHPYWTPGFKERAIYKDGFYFCSLEDLITQEAVASLVKKRIKNIDYTGRLLNFHNIDLNSFYQKLEQDIQSMDRILDSHKEEAIKNLPILKFRYKINNQEKEENNGSNQTD